jgi:bifunctional UDP-N-acetylglucosamine pyrophosphorylase / glucosamine-1-phosphate N-acetyltransferase
VSPTRPAAVVVLAAGEGTRMRSSTPKVLHEVGGRSLLGHVLAAAQVLDAEHLLVVVGHGRDQVVEHLKVIAPEALSAVQAEQLGTGHAVRIALAALPPLHGTVVVTTADTPMLTGDTLTELVGEHVRAAAAASVLTAEVAEPGDLGRVLRDADGAVTGIVEARDATTAQREIREVNSAIYAFDAAALADALDRITHDNAQGEEYLTDVIGLLHADGRVVIAYVAADAAEVLGVNDRVQLAAAGVLLRDRAVRHWQRAGVTVVDPASTWIGPDVELEPDVTLRPGVQLHGATIIRSGATVGPEVTLTDTVVGEGAVVVRAECHDSVIGPRAMVGPFAYLRPGTRLEAGAKAGSYVELKNVIVGEGSKVPHLSYVGDAVIGVGTNIGAATVFVNYDGIHKHATVVGDHVRIGSDTMLIAPVTVGDGAYTAAGSVIDKDVPPGAMAVARGRQRNVEGWVARRRAGTPSAAAAQRAAERTALPEAAQSTQDASDHDDQQDQPTSERKGQGA